MYEKKVNPNAKLALNQMKMEISNEIIGEANLLQDSNPVDSIGISARVGGQMSKRLVEMGIQELIKENKNTN